MKNVDLGTVFTSIGAVLRRFHVTLFIVFVVGGLSAAVLILNQMLIDSSNPSAYKSTIDSTTFDQATIDRIQNLKPSSDPASASVTLPSGRINPFSE